MLLPRIHPIVTARLVPCLVVAIGTASIARAQQTLPAVHPVGAIVAKTTEPIDRVAGIHVLSTGRVVVNDAAGRRVLLFDSTLTTFSTLLDTTGATARKYPVAKPGLIAAALGPLPGIVIPFVGDSTVFYDPDAVALVVFDPNGRIARIMAPPFPPDAGYLEAPSARFDSREHAIYLAGNPSSPRRGADGSGQNPRDSASIVRAASGSVAPETLAYVRTPKTPGQQPLVSKEGITIPQPIIDPFAVIDAWAMLADGTIAIMRGQDYHMDWIAANKARSASSKFPFQWHRLSDSEKVVIVDSVKQYNEAHPVPYRYGGREGTGNLISGTFPLGVIPPDSLGDYRPPFASPTMFADADENVWILPTPEVPLSANPGPVYDVISRAGQLIDRVQLSPGFGIVGFSPGYIFMTIREGATTVLVKAKIR
jgi:hypothetical protein